MPEIYNKIGNEKFCIKYVSSSNLKNLTNENGLAVLLKSFADEPEIVLNRPSTIALQLVLIECLENKDEVDLGPYYGSYYDFIQIIIEFDFWAFQIRNIPPKFDKELLLFNISNEIINEYLKIDKKHLIGYVSLVIYNNQDIINNWECIRDLVCKQLSEDPTFIKIDYTVVNSSYAGVILEINIDYCNFKLLSILSNHSEFTNCVSCSFDKKTLDL